MSRTEWAYQYGDGPMVRCSQEHAAGLHADAQSGKSGPVTIYIRTTGGEWAEADPTVDERPSAGPAGTRAQGPVTG